MSYYRKNTPAPKAHSSFSLSLLCLGLALINILFPVLWPYAQKCHAQNLCLLWVSFITLCLNLLILCLIVILSILGYRKLKLPKNHQQFPVPTKTLFIISLLSTTLLCLYRLVLTLT